ncbi:potassium transporter [Diplocarpon rosae]|nr:potassium transporter [Diplocarpon rosae]
MATVRIADAIHPIGLNDGTSSALAGGVYPIRNDTKPPSLDLRSPRSRSIERRGVRIIDHQPVVNDEGLRRDGDFKKKQIFTGKYLLWLAYQSTGVIYGDIGTSPLYVYSSTFSSEPSYQDLVGVLSVIIWSLTLMVTVKYVLIILYADNEGEGGTFSTYSLLSRFANITKRDPREASLIKMERYVTGDIEGANLRIRSRIENSKFARGLLKTIGVLAVSMVMADGVLTPAQSVLGAVQGLNVVKPDIEKSTIVGTTCGILVLLFLIQPFGTTKLASTFAPIVIVWLGFNAGFGIYNLVKFDHTVLKAFSPSFAFKLLTRNKTEGWRKLGGILLAFTGVEALFADLGAFSRKAIQISWLGYAMPCLLLGYIGQAAYISRNEGAYSNPFYNAVPPGMLYPSLVVAILAAIVASQAIITATFQLLSQVMKLSYFPQIKVVHTSKVFHGQVYVPFINWLLMLGTVLAAAIYNNTTSLGNAYGVCVMFVTFFDSCMISLVALIIWRLPYYVVFFPWLIFACMDGVYLSAALVKVPDGAWFTLLLSGVITSLLILWRFGKEQQWQAEADDRFPTTRLVEKGDDGAIKLTQLYGGDDLSTIKGFGIFFDKAGETTPLVFSQFLSKLVAAPEVMVFFHLRPLETPSVLPENRYTVTRVTIPNCYRLVVRHGYMDEVITPDLASLVYAQIRNFIVCQGAALKATGTCDPSTIQEYASAPLSRNNEKPFEDPELRSLRTEESIAADLAKLQHAFDRQVLYIIGKEQMRVRNGTGMVRNLLLNLFLWLRDNTRTKIANLRVQPDRVIEVGFVKDI